MYTFKSMELTDDEKVKDLPCATTCEKPQGPVWPWGLRISLTEREMAKLDISAETAQVGSYVHGHFMARVTSVSTEDRSDGTKSERVELQIEKLCIESEDAENAAADTVAEAAEQKPKRRSRLYA